MSVARHSLGAGSRNFGEVRQGKPATLSGFLNELMRRKRVRPSQLATQLGVSHATVGRWLSGEDIPSVLSCRRLAEYSERSVTSILSLAGHLPAVQTSFPDSWPDLREYVRLKYSDLLDEDIVTMLEDLIERRRKRRAVAGQEC